MLTNDNVFGGEPKVYRDSPKGKFPLGKLTIPHGVQGTITYMAVGEYQFHDLLSSIGDRWIDPYTNEYVGLLNCDPDRDEIFLTQY